MSPTPAKEAANLFLIPNESSGEVSSLRTVSVRMDAGRLAFVDSLAEHAEISRNAMVNELVKVGISEVMANLPHEIRAEVEASLAARLEDL